MLRVRVRYLFVAVTLLCATRSFVVAQELQLAHQISLPVDTHGTFDGRPAFLSEETPKTHFAVQVDHDQDLLVFGSALSGQWPLTRIQKWWTNAPTSEVLNLPGWSKADAKHLGTLRADVQTTPDGHYAIALAGAIWMDTSSFLLRAPRGYVMRKPDTIITLVDLRLWKVVGSMHTTTIAEGALAGVRVINDKWMVLDFSLGSSRLPGLLHRYDTRLISIADQKPGAACISDRLPRSTVGLGRLRPAPTMQNDAACKNVLSASNLSSVVALETKIYRDQDVAPKAVFDRIKDIASVEDDFFEGWGYYPYYLMYHPTPPLESPEHRWFALGDSDEAHLYRLTIFDQSGNEQASQVIRKDMCGDSALESRGSACGCRAVSVLESENRLLSYCRTQRGDFAGAVRKEWLAVVNTKEMNATGVVTLPKKDVQTLFTLAIGAGRVYAITVESGELVRIYDVGSKVD